MGKSLKAKSRGESTDMSGAAILRRLEIAAELRELAQTLGRAERVVENASKRD